MGIYLNSKKAFLLYQKESRAVYFVDKTSMLREFIGFLETDEDAAGQPDTGNPYICITRPRRFGKTVMANMIAAYLGKGVDSRKIFDNLEVGKQGWYGKHLNRHNVIYIAFNELPNECRTYRQYISRIEKFLLEDLRREFPDTGIEDGMAVWDALNHILELEEDVRFIFVLDEWDFVFHRDFVKESEKREFISFLSNLLKDQPYVELAYMTGILPIAKYSSGSELNMFLEYTMVSEEKYCDYFGFTEKEVDELYEKYVRNTKQPKITREGLRLWYDGYHTMSGGRVYNPRSVVAALTNNNLGNYWTSSGPYDELFYYIKKDIDGVRDALALMVSGESISVKLQEYAATSMELTTKEEIFSAMVVYGFLTSDKGKVFVPNKELMDQFERMLLKEPSLGYVYRLARESERMLSATLAGDTDTMIEILEYAHNTETPILEYNNETELAAIVNLVYLSARDTYRIEREDKAGIGYVDFIFYPKDVREKGIILELKVGRTPEEAIRQIKEREYALKFMGKLGEKSEYTGQILAVGIAYDRKNKKHSCKIEVISQMKTGERTI